jgi:toxin ParE1/3/4
MKVRFSDEALAKLRAIRVHIAEDSPKNADAMIDRILRRAERTADLPRSGRKVPEYNLDTLRQAMERPYRIIYRINDDEIVIVTVMHYRQLLPEDLA